MNEHDDLIKELENIVEQDYDKFYAIVYRITESHQDTEDVLQNSFLKAYKNLKNFRKQSKLSTWFYRIAINESYRYMQSWNKLPVIAIVEDLNINETTFFGNLEYDENFVDVLIVEEMREKCIRGFLKCVPQKMRVVFLLKTCIDLKNKEIAEILEIKENNVKVLLHRARKQLKEMFEYRCNLIDPSKPCKCYLWIKYMKDNNYPIPEGHNQYKNNELVTIHFKNMSKLKKMHYLFQVENTMDKDTFIAKIRTLSEIL
ncbi:MAG: hypothetical protein CVU95_11290 [Firmicutes bacterium HGW-Firmicutes-2]|jgi:RNA polymerase sigma-70 factor (ECF subfamily)|nr:MAG: hypothetical protein CVU95_11290 [Firmicutes bacterium HGW-Firmicutes-2]